MSSLPAMIAAYAKGLPEGEVLSAKGLLHLGNRAAVDQALSRLAAKGQLMRVGRGAYVAPVQGKYGQRSPEPARVVRSLAGQRGEAVVPHAAASANRLGLSLQVPMRPIYLTSGPSRKLHLGKQEVELRHAGRRSLRLGEGTVPEAIRALEWLGPEIAPARLPGLMERLRPEERKALVRSRPFMPTWLAAEVSRIAGDG